MNITRCEAKPSTKRVLAPEARAHLTALLESESISHLALRAKSTPITLENALAGLLLTKVTCARLEAFAARERGAS